MAGSAVPAAMAALAAAWGQQLGTTVPVGTPAALGDSARYVSGQVTDWDQAWGVTPHADAGLDGGRDERFTLTCRIYRRRLGGDVVTLMADIATDRLALEAAVRADWTLGGALSDSGMAQIVAMEQAESLADDRTRELGLTVSVACTAWIT
jgi:hypothetical protein